MATQGAFTIFDRAKLKLLTDGTLADLANPANTFKGVLTTVTQAISASFVGGSGDCRYADLTNELSTANGYTAAGLTLTTVALTRPTTSTVKFTSDALVWTLTNTITFKYFLIYNNSATNKDLLGFADSDTGGGSVSPIAGTLTITPNASGWFTLS